MLVFSTIGVFAQETRIEPNTNIMIESGTTLDISGGDLVLESSQNGDATLIDNGTISYSGGGEAKVQRFLTEGQWHLISSPIANGLSGMFTDDYFQFHSENTNGWTDIESVNYNLLPMTGYILWSVSGQATTEMFSGTTNTGLQTYSFTQDGDGWNLVGNPYPSNMNWDAVTIPAELNTAIWLFDPTIGENGDYRYYINGGGAANTTSSFIPSGQGFFVRATGGAGTLSFDNTCRAHGLQAFYKSDENAMLVLKATGNDITTQTAIRFNENATQEIDRTYDVYRIISDSPDVPMLFTESDNKKMAINTLPSIENNEKIPVWFKAGLDGNYSISASEIESLDYATPVYLEDIQTGEIQNLRDNPEYAFNYKTGSDKRFNIYFTEHEKINNKSNILIYSYQNTVNVKFPATEIENEDFNAQIMIFDIAGRMVTQIQTNEINNQITLNGSNSIYLVKVISGQETSNGKVFIQ